MDVNTLVNPSSLPGAFRLMSFVYVTTKGPQSTTKRTSSSSGSSTTTGNASEKMEKLTKSKIKHRASTSDMPLDVNARDKLKLPKGAGKSADSGKGDRELVHRSRSGTFDGTEKSRRTSTVVRWFKHITDAADTYKVKDGVRHRKQSGLLQQPSDSPLSDLQGGLDSAGTPPTDKLPSGAGISGSYDHDTGDEVEAQNKSGGSVESLDTVGQGVEVLHIEPARLVQPNEVVVSTMVSIEKLDRTHSPLECLREKNELIERTMNEKKLLVADILQIPPHEYDTIAEMVEEVTETSDVKELLLSSVTQADQLTRLVNDRLSVDNVQQPQQQHQQPVGSDANQLVENTTPAGGLPIVVSGAHLLSISSRLHRRLSRLMTVMIEKAQETERLRAELSHVQGQLEAMHASASTEELRSRSNSRSQQDGGASSRPHSFISAVSSASESNDSAEQLIEVSEEPGRY